MIATPNKKLKELEENLLKSEFSKIKERNLWGDAFSRLKKNKASIVAIIVLFTIILMAIFAPLISPWGFNEIDKSYDDTNVGPTLNGFHIFGLDSNGRDLFVRTLYGARISLMVGFISTFVSLVIGVIWGATAGFIGGKTDSIMMRIVDIIYSLPFIFVVILLMVIFGNNIILIFLALGMVEWLTMARIVRGQAISIKKKEYIEAAYAIGVPTRKIILRHIIPNVLGVVVVYVTLTVPYVILAESFLSFLGLGVTEPMASWGVLIGDGTKVMEIAPYRLIFPVIFLSTTLFCFNFIGDGLRDALDPKDR